MIEQAKSKCSRLALNWADDGYAGQPIDWGKTTCQWVLQIVKRADDVQGLRFYLVVGLSCARSLG